MLKLELLVLTMNGREKFLTRLLDVLRSQRKPGIADYLVRTCDPKYTLGENRDMLRRASTGEYIAFVDDDDLIHPKYVRRVLPQLDRDYVGFDVQCYVDGVPLKVTKHSLVYPNWGENEEFYYRDISHINPMRRELALTNPFEGGHGEDQRWAERMRGLVKTERYIPEVLYYYYFRTRKNMAGVCPKCGSESTVMIETCDFCNACGHSFHPHEPRRSCLWA